MKYFFLSSAEQGKNDVWRYFAAMLLATGLGLVGYLGVGLPMARAIARSTSIFEPIRLTPDLEEKLNPLSANSLEISYISTHVAYGFFCIGLWLAVKQLHQRKILTLISPDASFQWQRFGLGFGLWFALAAIQTGIEFLYNPAAFVWNFQPSAWFIFLPWALLLTPIQTSTEEFLFRGYLLQGLGLLSRQPILLTLMTSLPFAIAHFGNPEMARGAVWIGLTYLLMAAFLTLTTLQEDRLELALGIHAANNLFLVLIVNTPDAALPTPALVLQQAPTNPPFTFVALLIAIAIFYGVVFRRL
ncbi:MAG: CPBP family glutamic-type intramembrane protease [Leptolyngbyaceae cyanobacterium bins.349]|nr:CPBP family glutamic-type intramembrane protease [Leptolyngbyaceae cyanobacterium bins.349]